MTSILSAIPGTVLSRYQDNLPRHLIGFTRYLETRIMERLGEEFGHRGLRLSFEPCISLTAGGGARLSSIADSLGVSRQAANRPASWALCLPKPTHDRDHHYG